jgi:17beta-estradiol 17-dehydrogenase / 3beta-hydroxysteroid 3-dehydrogenase
MEGMNRWKGRTALITGASSGIGRAIAESLARYGMNVAVCARRRERLDALATDLSEAPGETMSLECDLRDEAAIEATFAAVRERFGGVDVMINNAGLGHAAPLTSGRTEAWREMLEVNVLALCICTREAVADMKRRSVDDGHVIHVSSMAAHRVPQGSGVYSASKYAVRALTEALRQELRDQKSKIRVSAISPGFVETEFAAHFHQSEEAAAKTYGRHKCLEDRDVAAAVVYVLAQPPHVQVHDLLMRPTEQMS